MHLLFWCLAGFLVMLQKRDLYFWIYCISFCGTFLLDTWFRSGDFWFSLVLCLSLILTFGFWRYVDDF